MTVPSVSPNMITTDIETQNTSVSNGITPSTVVPAARNTGRKRETAALITASKGVCPAFWSASISSIKPRVSRTRYEYADLKAELETSLTRQLLFRCSEFLEL